MSELWGWKLSVLRSSAPVIKRISTGMTATRKLAQGIMGLARALSGKKKPSTSE